MPVPVAPERWPALGHTPALPRRRFGVTDGLDTPGDLALVYTGTRPAHVVTTPEPTQRAVVADSGSFGKGIMFDKFCPFVDGGPGNSGAEKMNTAISRLSES
jgi:hypothetical protein